MITSQRREELYTCSALSHFLFFSPLDRSTLIDDHAVVYYVRCQYPYPSHDDQPASSPVPPVQL